MNRSHAPDPFARPDHLPPAKHAESGIFAWPLTSPSSPPPSPIRDTSLSGAWLFLVGSTRPRNGQPAGSGLALAPAQSQLRFPVPVPSARARPDLHLPFHASCPTTAEATRAPLTPLITSFLPPFPSLGQGIEAVFARRRRGGFSYLSIAHHCITTPRPSWRLRDGFRAGAWETLVSSLTVSPSTHALSHLAPP